MPFVLSVALLSAATALTCALPGTFLVLRKQSMLVEAMSHAVLPGIVIGALISGSTHSPVMVVAAACMGLLVVFGAHRLRASGLIAGDADQGLVFPFLFSIGVILLSTVLQDVHLCQDTVLTGDLNLMALTPEHVILQGGSLDLGPATMWRLLFMFCVMATYIAVFYRVLKISTFDPVTASTLGLPAGRVNAGLMFLVALTVVVAFDAAGAILVIALMVVPPATALLIARSLPMMIALSLVIALVSALTGFWLALIWDLATSSMMAFVDAVIFLLVFACTRFMGRARVGAK